MDVNIAQTLFTLLANEVSFMLTYILGVILTVLAALLGLGFAVRRVSLWIYDGGLGTGIRHFGKPPWKGYNRWRSEKWNMEHTI